MRLILAILLIVSGCAQPGQPVKQTKVPVVYEPPSISAQMREKSRQEAQRVSEADTRVEGVVVR